MKQFNCKPRKSQVKWYERVFMSKKWIGHKYCKVEHNLGYRPGYTANNGWYECPDCGATDIWDILIVDYKTHPWYDFE